MTDWTLFLDRDGVINKKAEPHRYITSYSDFEFLPKVLDAMKILSEKFHRIIIVINQQGVAKGVMTDEEVCAINDYMMVTVLQHGGHIDALYYCPHLEGTCQCRKPGTLMADWAKRDFPEIDFNKSYMVGDSESDMEFGRSIGAKTVLIEKDFSSLFDFAVSLGENK